MGFLLVFAAIIGMIIWAIHAAIQHDKKLEVEEQEREQERLLDKEADVQWPMLDILQAESTPKGFFTMRAKLDTHRKAVGVSVGKSSDELTNDFLRRFWFDCKERRINAVSDAAKQHALVVFFDTMELYGDQIGDANAAIIAECRTEYYMLYPPTPHRAGATK